MKKNVFVFVAILIVAMVSMVSCQPEVTNNAVGTWTVTVNAHDLNPSKPSVDWKITFTFKTDGTLLCTMESDAEGVGLNGHGEGKYGLFIGSTTEGAFDILLTIDTIPEVTNESTYYFIINGDTMNLIYEGDVVFTLNRV